MTSYISPLAVQTRLGNLSQRDLRPTVRRVAIAGVVLCLLCAVSVGRPSAREP